MVPAELLQPVEIPEIHDFLPDAGMPPVPELERALSTFTEASRRVEDYYRHLDLEVKRLAHDLELKNRELQRKVQERERMQAMLLSTLQSLTCGVLAVGRDGIVVAANPAACEIFGGSLQEIAGRTIEAVLAEIPESARLIESLAHGGRDGARVEWVIEENGHRRRCIEFTAVAAGRPSDRHLAGLVIANDVTSLRRLERQEIVSSRLAGIGEMAMSLAHEIRNPLGTIALYASSLAHELEGDHSLGPLASQLLGGVHSLEHVVTNVLEFARPRRLAMARVDLAIVLREALAFVEHPRAQKKVSLDMEIIEIPDRPGAAQPLVSGDAEQIRQVFLNVALNALQAMGEGGRLRAALRPHGRDAWEVEIADSGVGIPAEDIPRIFDPFFTTKEKGSGIGLALVHRTLTAHRAQIEVESRPGEGTTFRMIFQSDPFSSEV